VDKTVVWVVITDVDNVRDYMKVFPFDDLEGAVNYYITFINNLLRNEWDRVDDTSYLDARESAAAYGVYGGVYDVEVE
jgi:hypothetical protein